VVEAAVPNATRRTEIYMLELPSQWDQVRVKTKSARSLSIDELAANPARFWSTVEKVNEIEQSSGQCLVFGASIAHCYALAGALKSRGTMGAVVSYRTPSSQRRRLLERFSGGDLRVIFNKALLAEGYDCPAITDVVLATPIRSSILWEQIVGRASRGPAVGGTPIGRIWELDDHRAMHRDLLSYARFLGDLWD
jgi:superfamily II DNA or RNA helicase